MQPTMTRRAGTVLVTVVLLAGCGTRLPDSAFVPAATVPPVAPGSSTPGSGGPNTASDVGVTATDILVGLVASRTSVLGAEAFSGPMYGALAYFDGLNARGGINGRRVTVNVCDDTGSGTGNSACVEKLIDQDKVFAFAGNSAFQYAGAKFVSDKGVPDIGGQPIGSEYDQYQHLYSIYGSSSPRDGTVGFGGKLFGGTEVYRYFKEALGARVAEVVAYNQADSQRFASYTADGLRAEGYEVFTDQVDFGVANWDAVAINMRSRKVDVVFDALENSGNVNLCKAMDRNGVKERAKAVTVQGWTDAVRTDYGDSPTCRNALYATATGLNYNDVQFDVVKSFRDDMKRVFPDREDRLSMWALEGWAAAQWFTDAAGSCGSQLTRVCLEAYMNRPDLYDGHGLLTGRNFVVSTDPGGLSHNCLNVARWQDSALDGRGGWVTQVPDMNKNCPETPTISYSP